LTIGQKKIEMLGSIDASVMLLLESLMRKKKKKKKNLNLTEVIEKQEHETSMDIILHPPVVIKLDDDEITNIDGKMHMS
jgi:hypothetical protein